MRIVEVVPQLASGGGERFVVDLCNELVHLGHEVRLIVTHSLERPDLAFYLPEVDKRVDVISMNKRPGADLGIPFRLYKAIREFRPDVVHTHLNAILYSWVEVLRADRVVFCHTVHNAAEKEAGPSFFSREMRRLLFKNKRVLPMTISEESRDSFRKFYGMDAHIIYNGRNIPENIKGVDFSEYKATPQTRVIINLARIMKVKRQDLIARVCRRLELEGYDFVMLMIGRKADKSVVDVVKAANCSRVYMLGERRNPLAYLTAADGYCLMSEYEGMPISLIEALGCSAVPICTPIGGVKNIINDGINGFLSDDLSEESCYIALKKFLELTPEKLEDMKHASFATYAPYSMSTCANQYVAFFKSHIIC